MKKLKTIKLILIILICILIMMVGYVGILKKEGNAYKNILPTYKFASDIKGATILEFEVDDSKQTIYYDKEGRKVDSSTITEENERDYDKVEEPVNSTENLNNANYKKVIEIMKKRLEFLKADQYRLDLDNDNGKIILTFEDEYEDDIKSFLPMEGKLQLVDTNSSDVILDYTDFTAVETTYAAKDDGSYDIYLSFKLNNNGLEKYNKFDNYKNTSVEKDDDETETTNKFKISFDGEELYELEYNNSYTLIGKTLRITTSSNVTSNSTIQSKMNMNTVVSKLSTIGKLPVVYKLSAQEYVNSIASQETINYIIIGLVVLCVIASIYFIIRYKVNGILSVITFATNIALFLILLRLTKVEVSLNGFAGIFGLIILNTILVNNILKCINVEDRSFSENVKSGYMKSIDVLVISLILFMVFSFASMTTISSIGLVFFWGWTVIVLGNLLLTVPLLSVYKKN